jgi:trimethylguanosine synthase
MLAENQISVLEHAGIRILYKMTRMKMTSTIARRTHQTPAPPEIPEKYWSQRYNYFNKFDEGIQMDAESWFMVTHENIANRIARRVKKLKRIMDGFAGVCGNVIAFAAFADVIAIDIERTKLEFASNNASIYNREERIEFVHGDFFEKAEAFGPVDAVFLSPPWGGPTYKDAPYDIFTMMTPDVTQIIEMCNRITRNIIFYLPRNIDPR